MDEERRRELAEETDRRGTALTELLHRGEWAAADRMLEEALEEGRPGAVLAALAMLTTGAREHLPTRGEVLDRVLSLVSLDEGALADQDPGLLAALARMVR